MQTSPDSSASKLRRALPLIAAVFAFLLIGFASSSCTGGHQVGVAPSHSPGVIAEHDLPYDYLSARYRQLYRTDPDWFHHHNEASYYNPYVGK